MPELRTDPITGRQVIIAPERAERPFEHGAPQPAETLDRCPFCAGNEDATPEAVLTVRDEDDPARWRVRIVPNRYPAVSASPEDPRPDSNAGLFHTRPVAGRHEVVIESPDHECRMHQLPLKQFKLVVKAWRDRLRAIRDEGQATHVTLFKNEGAGAGASLEHVHSQILATPFVPPVVEEELAAGARFLDEHGCNAWLEMIDRELEVGSRIIGQSDALVTFCPFASRFPAEMWIVPRRECPDFDSATDDELGILATALKDALERLDRSFPNAACNVVVHTAPFHDDDRKSAMQWHIQITPRMTGIAGYEIGAGAWVNIVAPEDAAVRLRTS
jgi:UDPglucose--hexose-1-phosphate uridylyltransferase